MHIVFVSREYVPSLRGGGIASYIKDMANGLSALGYKITVICASDDTRLSSDNFENGIRVIRLSGGDFIIPSIEGKSNIRKFRCIYRFYSYRKRILKTILSLNNIDIIEVPEFGAEGYYLMNLKIPVVVRLHTPSLLDRSNFGIKKYPLLKFYEYWCAKKEENVVKRAKYITSCSNSLKDWVVNNFKINENIIRVIYNPIKVSDWTGEKVNHCDNYIRLLYVGTVAREKGIGDLIEACKILIKKGYKIKLSIAGKVGKYGSFLKESNKDLLWCKFLGNINRNDLRDLYLNNSIACFPSWWEAFGIICVEAMATKCIVIGSNKGGMSEIINDGYNGFLVTPKDPLVLSKSIEYVCNLDSNKIKEIRSNALNDVLLKFDISSILKETLSYYKNIIINENTLG